MSLNRRIPSADAGRFAVAPSTEVPRSTFSTQHTLKTTFDAGWLIPIYLDEVLPGDTHQIHLTAFARLSTPFRPIMDNLYLETFFFFVPCRLLWDNWVRMMGQQDTPGASIDYVIPKITSPAGGWVARGLADFMGLPTVGQVTAGQTVQASVLPFRAYNLIFNEWFRDENLMTAAVFDRSDTPGPNSNFPLRRRAKRFDFFTSCLPSPQKGPAVQLPLGQFAPVQGLGFVQGLGSPSPTVNTLQTQGAAVYPNARTMGEGLIGAVSMLVTGPTDGALPSVYADLSAATASTVNQLRQAFAIQRLLEKSSRYGTRYTEVIYGQFKVDSPDARLQRPEYLGGGSTPVTISAIEQNSASGLTGSATPLGTLGAAGTVVTQGHQAQYTATEHGYILGLANVRADLTYQQGLPRMWSRSTRYDFYTPSFAHLGERAVLREEIYCNGVDAEDSLVFGYQEHWSEMRYKPNRITSMFRSTTTGTLDVWHLAQRFLTAPTLSETFILDDPPMGRVLTVDPATFPQQSFLFDGLFNVKMTRPLPMYSVPGLIDHF